LKIEYDRSSKLRFLIHTRSAYLVSIYRTIIFISEWRICLFCNFQNNKKYILTEQALITIRKDTEACETGCGLPEWFQ